LFFYDTKKPIIITAAQRSIDRGSSDAFMNLTSSINAAANFDGAGVFVCMHENSNDDFCSLINASKVRKMHTSRRDAFRSINSMPIAEIYKDKEIKILNKNYNKRDDNSKIKADLLFEEKVGFIQSTPLIDPNIIDFYIDNKYKGLVISGTGLGHVPLEGKNSLAKKLEKAKSEGIIVITSQCIYGRVNPYVYSNARELLFKFDVIYSEDMTPEFAFIKLGWVLGHTNDRNKIKEMMLTNYSGEINEIIDEKSFLN
jgi:glutamyl-tRNA(Gln) amidotransferase subunit D